MTHTNQTAPAGIAYAARLADYALDTAQRTYDNYNEFCQVTSATPEQWQKLETLWRAVIAAQRAATNARATLAARIYIANAR